MVKKWTVYTVDKLKLSLLCSFRPDEYDMKVSNKAKSAGEYILTKV